MNNNIDTHVVIVKHHAIVSMLHDAPVMPVPVALTPPTIPPLAISVLELWTKVKFLQLVACTGTKWQIRYSEAYATLLCHLSLFKYALANSKWIMFFF